MYENLLYSDEYMLLIKVIGSTTTTVNLRINADTGSNYGTTYISNTTVTVATAQTSAILGQLYLGQHNASQFIFPGKTPAQASGVIQWVGGVGQAATIIGIGGYWVGGNATQITSFTLLPISGTISGKIEFFGRNHK